MKTEQQCLARLEKLVDALSEAAEAMAKDDAAATEDQKLALASYLSPVMAMAWVLDQEDEMRTVLSRVKLADTVINLAEKGF